eukprot:4941373-Amphidinium_carterae.1
MSNASIARREHDFVYLGALFADTSNTLTSVKGAIAAVMATVKQLQLFWKHGLISEACKLRIEEGQSYDAQQRS